jgi:hypothetical protein
MDSEHMALDFSFKLIVEDRYNVLNNKKLPLKKNV